MTQNYRDKKEGEKSSVRGEVALLGISEKKKKKKSKS